MKFTHLLIFLFCGLNCFSAHCFDYKKWWDDWYASGRTSGAGSRGVLAEFKADVMNDFLSNHTIHSVVEFGCGDGYNLALMKYKKYLGLDVSKTSIKLCTAIFKEDTTKSFMLYDPNFFTNKNFNQVDLVVCLDVLYHIINEDEYKKVLDDIFSYEAPYVILYTTLYNAGNSPDSPEILHRDVFPYLQKYSNYEITIKKQKHQDKSIADFIFLERKKA
jgi:SAM-dependent methyltransferase